MAEHIRGIFQPGKPPKLVVEGVKGPSCVGLLEPYQKALGTVESQERTAEYAETPALNEVQTGNSSPASGIQ